MGVAEIVAGMMFGALLLYAALGGADFGGGIWDLLASGPRAAAQRALIERAIAPVWEANHVWLVVVVVILFTAFPAAFAFASIALHVPLTLVLVGVVVRGSAFVFRKYDPSGERAFHRRSGRAFAIGSLVTPFFLGVSLGAVTSGRLTAATTSMGTFAGRYLLPWVDAFSLLVGALGITLFAFLSAVYLTVEARDPDLRRDFRTRAVVAGLVTLVLSGATAAAASTSPMEPFRRGFSNAAWIVLPLAAASWLLVFWSLHRRRFVLARFAAIAVLTVTLSGWAAGQYPRLVAPDITIRSAAAPSATLRPLMVALVAGAFILFPAMIWLLRVFKHRER
jgi:cytochrome d ubiquinol oxidase subunit II